MELLPYQMFLHFSFNSLSACKPVALFLCWPASWLCLPYHFRSVSSGSSEAPLQPLALTSRVTRQQQKK